MSLDLSAYDAGFDPPTASEDELAKARAEGAKAERERLKAICEGPLGQADFRGAVLLALSGAEPTKANLYAQQEQREKAAAASWDAIITENSKRRGGI